MGPMQTLSQKSFKTPWPPLYHFISRDEDEEPEKSSRPLSPVRAPGEDLPYRVEVLGEDAKAVEQTLALTANGSIGYAAYYEATREYPDRCVILRHKNRIVARWNPTET